MSKPDPRLQGAHKKTSAKSPGTDCGGKVRDGSCEGCGADFIDVKNIKQAPKAKDK